MNQDDLLFVVLILIGLSSLTIVIVQFVRSRRRNGRDGDGSENWWDGPWDDDRKR